MAHSAGILLYRFVDGGLEVLIGHPGGPLWRSRDDGAWSIPKGLIEVGEEPLEAALREFVEETGFAVPSGELISLGSITQRSGKRVTAWAVKGDARPEDLRSNLVVMKWPRRTGRSISFPELDRVIWASEVLARQKLNPAQGPLITRLVELRGLR